MTKTEIALQDATWSVCDTADGDRTMTPQEIATSVAQAAQSWADAITGQEDAG